MQVTVGRLGLPWGWLGGEPASCTGDCLLPHGEALPHLWGLVVDLAGVALVRGDGADPPRTDEGHRAPSATVQTAGVTLVKPTATEEPVA